MQVLLLAVMMAVLAPAGAAAQRVTSDGTLVVERLAVQASLSVNGSDVAAAVAGVAAVDSRSAGLACDAPAITYNPARGDYERCLVADGVRVPLTLPRDTAAATGVIATAVTPATGLAAGGELVDVAVSGPLVVPSADARCRFGATVVPAVVVTDGAVVTCRAPAVPAAASAPVTLAVSVSMDGAFWSAAAAGVEFTARNTSHALTRRAARLAEVGTGGTITASGTHVTLVTDTNARSDVSAGTGKFYYEFSHDSGLYLMIGCGDGAAAIQGGNAWQSATSFWFYASNGQKYQTGAIAYRVAGGLTPPQRYKVAVDADTGSMWIGVVDTEGWFEGGDPATATAPTWTGMGLAEYHMMIGSASGAVVGDVHVAEGSWQDAAPDGFGELAVVWTPQQAPTTLSGALSAASVVLSGGSLTATAAAPGLGDFAVAAAVITVGDAYRPEPCAALATPCGAFYAEFTVVTVGSAAACVIDDGAATTGGDATGAAYTCVALATGTVVGAAGPAVLPAAADGDVVGVVVDAESGGIWIGLSRAGAPMTWAGEGNPGARSRPLAVRTAETAVRIAVGSAAGTTPWSAVANFGASPPAHPAPINVYAWVRERATAWTVMDPVATYAGVSISEGGLLVSGYTTDTQGRSSDGVTTGRFYWEVEFVSGQYLMAGVSAEDTTYTGGNAWADANSYFYYASNGWRYNTGGEDIGYPTTAAGATLRFALDADTRQLWIGRVGTGWFGGDPVTGTGAMWTVPGSYALFVNTGSASGAVSVRMNFGQNAFGGAVPAGFSPGFGSHSF